jgi:NAD(P)-dependent dehydrogenase (short-subunit alcohol dehydrogenase family)
MQLEDLKGKAAIVTGGGSGIGRASAQYLGSQGVAVLVADLAEDDAAATVASIVGAGGRAVAWHTDVAAEESVRSAVAAAVSEFGAVNLLHSNAEVNLGVRDQDVVTMNADAWDQTFAVNLRGPMLFCKHLLPHMFQNGGGSIVFTSSIEAQTAGADATAYAASKAGVESLVANVATQYGRWGIRANGVAAGLIVTERLKELIPVDLQGLYQRHQIVPGYGGPSDVAAAAAFLLSDVSKFISGQILNVDGGILAHTPVLADSLDLYRR